jgi:hypothetical protein
MRRIREWMRREVGVSGRREWVGKSDRMGIRIYNVSGGRE